MPPALQSVAMSARNRRWVSLISLLVALVGQLAAPRLSGQAAPLSEDAKRFVGSWRYISDTGTGIMIYDNVGNMAAQVMPNRPRAKFAGPQPTPEEAKDAFT